jgi:hypothetical protein
LEGKEVADETGILTPINRAAARLFWRLTTSWRVAHVWVARRRRQGLWLARARSLSPLGPSAWPNSFRRFPSGSSLFVGSSALTRSFLPIRLRPSCGGTRETSRHSRLRTLAIAQLPRPDVWAIVPLVRETREPYSPQGTSRPRRSLRRRRVTPLVRAHIRRPPQHSADECQPFRSLAVLTSSAAGSHR